MYLWAQVLKAGQHDGIRISREDVNSATVNLDRALRKHYTVPVLWSHPRRHYCLSYDPPRSRIGWVTDLEHVDAALWAQLHILDDDDARTAVKRGSWSPGGFRDHTVGRRVWPGWCVTHVIPTWAPVRARAAPVEMSCLMEEPHPLFWRDDDGDEC